jgi:hypothetical protein
MLSNKLKRDDDSSELIAPQQVAAPGLSCLPLGRRDRHQRGHRQSRLFSLLSDPLIVGYASMMKFAASLPPHSMHIIRPQS